MLSLLSSRSKNVQAVPASYVQEEQRPGEVAAPVCKDIPVIDLAAAQVDRDQIIQQITKVSQDLGMFQVMNHGVPEVLMADTMSLFKEFFDMPAEDKAMYYSDHKTNNSFKVFTSSGNHVKDGVNFSRDWLIHLNCHPDLQDNFQSWPEKPARYREVVRAYSAEVRKLSLRILDLICEGLGLELGCFGDDLSKVQILAVHHYPPCPDSSLVLGLGGHYDPQLLTLVQQELSGLQVLKNGQWVGVEPHPQAFVVNISDQLEIISNGKLKSPYHRAAANASAARTSIVTGITPCLECVIEPAKALVSASDPQLFKSSTYQEYYEIYMANSGEPTRRLIELFKLQV